MKNLVGSDLTMGSNFQIIPFSTLKTHGKRNTTLNTDGLTEVRKCNIVGQKFY